MQLHFQTDYLKLLFSDLYFQDSKILGVKATQAYRLAVNYILSADSVSDLSKARFLNLSPCNDGSNRYSIDIDNKRQLIISIEEQLIVLHHIHIKETEK